jgi:ribonucleoside-diphosphate reductase alpha chain
MQVVKRNGHVEAVSFDKVQNRIQTASDGLDVNPTLIAQRTLARIYDGVKTSELDELAAQLSISLMTTNPDYGTLAARIAISNHHRNTSNKFTDVVKELSHQKVNKTGETVSNVSQELLDICEKHGDAINQKIDYQRDYLFDYFGFKTLEKLQYLLRDTNGKTVERPQHLIMRVSLALWGSIDLERAFETYDLLSHKYFIHATPTNFNAGTPRQQLSSCFVEGTQVHTMNGVKNIEDVIIGDEVVTHTGKIKKVSQLHKNPLNNRIIYDIKLAGTPTVSVTENHRLWSISDEQEKWGKSAGWNSVEYLRVGDWIAIPKKEGGTTYVLDIKNILDNFTTDGNKVSYRYDYTIDGKVTPFASWTKHFSNEKTVSTEKKGDTFNRYWTFDDTMMELMGIWYGDGCIVHGKNSANQKVLKAVNIVSYHNNQTLIDFVTDTFYEKLGIRHVTVSQDKNNMVCMTVNNQYIAYIFKEVFKSGFDGKRIPAFFHTLPYESICSFLAGLVSSDGCVNDKGGITIQLTNPPLVNDIFHLARSVGIPITMTLMSCVGKKATGRMSIPSIIVNHKIKKAYYDNRIQLYEDKIHTWNQTRVIDGITYMRLNNKIPTNKRPEYVYTLGIDDDHSYSVGGFIAENCFLLAMKGDSISGIYDTLKDCALISKHAGGIGLHLHNIRAKGALIRGTNGTSNGIVPMLRNFNDTARYVDQCFTPDTLVYTEQGPKLIEDVSISDKVLTSEGIYHKVKMPIRHEYNGKMLEIQVKNAIYPIRVTPEHQILALQHQAKGLNFDVIRNRLEKSITKAEFVDANTLNKGDFVVFPIPTYTHDIEEITEEDCRFYGIMLGDGHISYDASGVTLNETTKINTLEFVKQYLTDKGIKYNIYKDDDSSIDIKWSTATPRFKWTRSQLYDTHAHKKWDTPMLHLPLNKIQQIIRGIIETDGCVGEKEITIELSSLGLIESIRYALLRLGALSSGYVRNRVGNVSSYKNITTRLPTNVIRVPRIQVIMDMFPNAPNGEFFSYLTHGNYIYSRIQDITEVNYAGIVHDFEIDGPHDYTVAHLGIAHNGGGKRNGSFAMYLEPWHADIEDFLKLKLNTGSEEERCRDLFYGLWIPDLFMERVEKNGHWTLFCPSEAPGLADVYGDEFKALYERYEAEGRGRKQIEAQKLWFKMLDAQIETGTPYLLYKDAANMKSNQKNVGTIKSSNLCVAPETYILTNKGQVQISEVAGQEVNVWNGDKWSTTTVLKTGEQQRLITVHLSNGAQITCTPYHKFIIRKEYKETSSIKDATRVEAWNLKKGMKLTKHNLQVVQGDEKNDIPYAYTHGFFCGDGVYHHNSSGSRTNGVTLYGVKKDLIPYLDIRSSSYKEDALGRINTLLPNDLADKYVVPLNASLTCRLEWFAGLLDADGCVVRNGTNEALQIASIHLEFLDRVRLMLQTLGVQSKVTPAQGERKIFMPDGKGGRKEYDCKQLWRLLISSSAVHLLRVLGLTCHRLQIKGDEPQRNAEQFVTVVSVVDDGRVDDTYCFNEPENHAGVFNGVLTGNCTEIIEYSDENETAVCNLASIALPSYVDTKKRTFDFEKLREVVTVATKNLNRVIDINYYPTPETRASNMRHRPVGLGVQGLADVFALLRMPWESEKAADLNQRIFEHIYYAAVSASADVAKVEGTYSSYEGSPMSQGIFQYDMWNVTPLTELDDTLDWASLKEKVKAHGVRNSLLVAPMPTASTSQILGFNECIEPFTSNMYTRRTLAGEFIVINKYLLQDLKKLGLWNEMMKQQIIAQNGSIQGIDQIPEAIQKLYKTSWELKQKVLIDMAARRGAFICQSQSLNLFVADPNYAKLTSMHFYAWKQGLKTGIYYLRTRAPVMAQKFTVDPELQRAAEKSEIMRQMKKTSEEECTMCGS